MAERKRRSFTPEFKRQVIEEIAAGKKTIAEVAKEHGITRSVLDRWAKSAPEPIEFTMAKAELGDVTVMPTSSAPSSHQLESARGRIALLEARLDRANAERDAFKLALEVYIAGS